MNLRNLLILLTGTIVAVILLPSLFEGPVAPAAKEAVSEASGGKGSGYSAAVSSASASEPTGVLNMINSACKMYQMENSSGPSSLSDLINTGYLKKSDMDGYQFKNSDYTIRAFGDLGNGRTGVLSATVRDSSTGQAYKLTWDTARNRYTMDPE